MDHPAVIFRVISDWKRRQGMAFREVWVTQVKEVLRAWLSGAGKRPAARRAGVDVKTAARYIAAARAAGLARDGDGSQLTDGLLGVGGAAGRAAAGGMGGWEAGWGFLGGMFKVVIPDNLKPVVDKADRLEPRWNREWLEYAQARGLMVDPARVRSPQDKGRVESGVKFTQRSFFAGEQFAGIADAQSKAEDWCRNRAGMRVHGTPFHPPPQRFPHLQA